MFEEHMVLLLTSNPIVITGDPVDLLKGRYKSVRFRYSRRIDDKFTETGTYIKNSIKMVFLYYNRPLSSKERNRHKLPWYEFNIVYTKPHF